MKSDCSAPTSLRNISLRHSSGKYTSRATLGPLKLLVRFQTNWQAETIRVVMPPTRPPSFHRAIGPEGVPVVRLWKKYFHFFGHELHMMCWIAYYQDSESLWGDVTLGLFKVFRRIMLWLLFLLILIENESIILSNFESRNRLSVCALGVLVP